MLVSRMQISPCQSRITQEVNKQLRTLQSYRCTEIPEKERGYSGEVDTLRPKWSRTIPEKMIFSINMKTQVGVKIMQAIDIRNFLVYMLSIVIGLRSSNLIFLTVKEYNDEIEDCYQMSSRKYKTSFLYGSKYILMDPDMYLFLGLYIRHCRPCLITEDGRHKDDKR